jgi:hypothetical protein
VRGDVGSLRVLVYRVGVSRDCSPCSACIEVSRCGESSNIVRVSWITALGATSTATVVGRSAVGRNDRPGVASGPSGA